MFDKDKWPVILTWLGVFKELREQKRRDPTIRLRAYHLASLNNQPHKLC